MLSQQEADCHAHIEAVTRKLLNWISQAGTIPGKKRDRLLLLYDYLDQLGLSEEVEEIHYRGSTYQLIRATEAAASDTTQGMIRGVRQTTPCFSPLFFSVKVRWCVASRHSLRLDAGCVCAVFGPETCLANTTGSFLSASRVGDPALDWGGWALGAESERGPALKSVTISRSLSPCQFSHPSQGSLLSGSLVPRSWLERAFQQPFPSLKLARMLDEPTARLLPRG